MKKIKLLLGVIAASLLLASCASKGTAEMDQNTGGQMAPASHHDYKGEEK